MVPAITDEQVRQFHDQGYFILENVFSIEEMEGLTRSIEAYQQRHDTALREKGGSEGISRAGEISFTSHLAEKDDALREFVLRPEFVTIATRLLGPDVDLYWNQAVFKGPEGEKEFPWHQDDGYTPVEPSPYLTLWLALNDATPENGCISVMPGSHTNGRVPHRESPIGLICHDLDDPNQGVQVPVKAGSMAVFQSLMFHKSGVNRSKGMRKAYIVQYAHAGLKSAITGQPVENLIPLARGGRLAETISV